jgi:hypothetical protein
MSSVEKLLQLPSSFSDGSTECFVPPDYVVHTADELYKRKLANMWMEHNGLAIEGWLLRLALKWHINLED